MSNKILIHRNETVDDVVEKIRSVRGDEVVVVIPKGSNLRSGPHTFEYIREEADAEGKQIRIESVDDEIVAMARAAGMAGAHPFFGAESKGSSFSDIVPAGKSVKRGAKSVRAKEAESEDEGELPSRKKAVHAREQKEAKEAPAPRHHAASPKVKEEVSQEDEIYGADEQDAAYADLKKQADTKIQNEITKFAFGQKSIFAKELPEGAYEEEKPSSTGRYAKIAGAFVLAMCAGVGIWMAGNMMAKARVEIASKTTPWEGSVSITGTISQKKIDPESKTIPVEYFENTKSYTLFTPATGKKDVSQKAAGTLTIVNEFSSAPQPLVATTRFQLPDGRIYRLVSAVTVPGAKIQDGKILPSSVEAKIVADQPGDSYNATSTDILKIPGFKDSPKYDKFYGKNLSVSGGFSGEKAYPVDADVEAAKSKMTETLTAALKSDILNSRSGDFRVLDGASDIAITRMQVSPDVNTESQFGTIASGAYRAIGFRENDIKDYFLAEATKGLGEDASARREWRSLEIEYTQVAADMENRTLRMTIKAKGILQQPFDESAFREAIKGKSLADAKSVILENSGIANGTISIWPMWVSMVPADSSKIEVQKD